MHVQSCRLPIQPIAFLTFSLSSHPWNLGSRSIQPKFRPVRPGKEDHLKRWTRFFETFPVGPNRSIEFWTEISGNFGWMDRALKSLRRRQRQSKRHPKSEFPLFQTSLLLICKNDGYFSQELNSKGLYLSPSQYLSSQKKKRKSLSCVYVLHKTWN